MITGGLCFVGVAVIVRFLGTALPAPEAAFMRFLIGLIFMFPFLLRGIKSRLTFRQHRNFAIRGCVHSLAFIFWFYAMARIPIAEVTAIGYLSPLFVTIGAALFFGEVLRIRRILSIVIGFLGALLILRPGFQEISTGQLAQLIASPLFAASFLLAKKQTADSESSLIVAMLTLYCTLILLPIAVYQWQMPSLSQFLLLAGAAFFATAGQYCITQACTKAPLIVLQPFAFLQLVWATLFGILLFSDPLDVFVIVGGCIIVAATTYMSHREMRRRQDMTSSAR